MKSIAYVLVCVLVSVLEILTTVLFAPVCLVAYLDWSACILKDSLQAPEERSDSGAWEREDEDDEDLWI
jgi:hypothetical protein